MGDMIVKSVDGEILDKHLTSILKRVQQYNMRLNIEKFTFGVIGIIF